MHPITRRLGAFVAASGLMLSGTALTVAPAHAAPTTDPRPATVGADWLAGQLTSGLMHNPNFGGFDDYGLSIDSGLALDAVGGHGTDVHAISTALAGAIGSYVTGDDFGDTGSSYAGQTAKAAVFADVAGDDPTSYGGLDLISRLEARVSSTAPITGRIEDLSPVFGGDFSNSIGQAFAVNALEAATSTKAPDALAFLLKQQCTAGYFRLKFTPDKAATDQTCDGGRAAGDSSPDADATSTAIRLLLPQINTSSTVARAIGRAESWLLAQQRADGSFGGGVTTAASNANSTGLAGWSLGLLGDTDASSAAAVWIRRHQADEVTGCTNALSSETGAIGYDDSGLGAGLKDGITDATSDQWRRATAQALPALQWAPAATPALTIKGPSGFVKAGSTLSYLATGAVPGDKVCLTTDMGAPVRGVAGADGTALLHAVAFKATADQPISISDREGDHDQTSTFVLGAIRFGVHLSKTRVYRGHLVRVRVDFLAPGEPVHIRFRGRTVSSGSASSTGTYVATFNVLDKLGPAPVWAFGKFTDIRRGAATLTVVR